MCWREKCCKTSSILKSTFIHVSSRFRVGGSDYLEDTKVKLDRYYCCVFLCTISHCVVFEVISSLPTFIYLSVGFSG